MQVDAVGATVTMMEALTTTTKVGCLPVATTGVGVVQAAGALLLPPLGTATMTPTTTTKTDAGTPRARLGLPLRLAHTRAAATPVACATLLTR